MKCCPVCFGDRGLLNNIFPFRSHEKGTCDYCRSPSVALLEASDLVEYFQLLISAYRPDPTGKLLVRWFREDWGLFDHLDDAGAKDLLADVLDDGNIVRRRFRAHGVIGIDPLGDWQKLRDELMYQNRFFPSTEMDLERLSQLLSHLRVSLEELPTIWYRARIQTSETPFPLDQMGAPPKRFASHGRANPAGIPYLYLGSTPTTAVSELRPHTGEVACVAKFTTPEGMKLVDLRRPRRTVSPFLLPDAADVVRMRCDLPFLERLGEELTRPVLPHAAAIDYTPSQYLCEFIKKEGFDGVVYRSSVSDGINLALFNPALTPTEISQILVTRVSVEVDSVRA